VCPDPLFDFVTARSVVSVRFGLFGSSCSHVQPDLELATIFLLLTAQWGGVCFLVDLLPLRSVFVISDLWRCVGSLPSSGRSGLFPACVWLPVSVFLLESVLPVRSPIVGSSNPSSVFEGSRFSFVPVLITGRFCSLSACTPVVAFSLVCSFAGQCARSSAPIYLLPRPSYAAGVPPIDFCSTSPCSASPE
jgi:hypothetical protein